MTLKLNGSTDGSVSIDAPADTSPTGSDITLTLPTTVGSANQFVKNGGTAGELEYSSMVETSTGVGIGTSAPGEEFVVRADAPSVQLESSNASGRNYGLQSNNDGNLFIYDGTAGANRVTLDSSGRLLVGTTSSIETNSVIQAVNASNSTVIIGNTDTSASGEVTINLAPSNSITGGQVRCAAEEDFSVGANRTARLEFNTRKDGSLAERMRILSDGYTQMSNNTSDSQYFGNTLTHIVHQDTDNRVALVVENSGNSTPSGILIDFSDGAPDNNSAYFITGEDSSTVRFRIWSDGDLDNHDNSYGAISDEKLKQDIVDAGSQWDDLKDLRVRKFKFKSDVAAYGDEAKTLIGLVAQEAETVCPNLVKDNPDLDEEGNDLGTVTKSVRYSVLYMKAIKALQEAQTRIETLETQNTAQQAQIDDLLARVTALEAAE